MGEMAVPVKYRKEIHKSPASDPQRYLVYRMEAEAFGGRGYYRLTRPSLKRLARSLCKNYGMPQVKIRFKDLGRWAAEWEEPNILTFGTKKTSQDLITLIHELAHHLHHHMHPLQDQEGHGPEFMACYMSILDVGRIIPVVGMRAICDSYGVRFVDPGTRNSLRDLRKAVNG